MSKLVISTSDAPQAIGTYSQAIRKGNIIFLSGQIGLDPKTMNLVEGIEAQIHQVFKNMHAVVKASGCALEDMTKLNIYLTDLAHFSLVNEIMKEYYKEPFPARAAVGVASLPKGALIEADGFIVID